MCVCGAGRGECSPLARLPVALPRPFCISSPWAARGWGSKLAGDVRGWSRGDGCVRIRPACRDGGLELAAAAEKCLPPSPRPPLTCGGIPPAPPESPGCRARGAALPGCARSGDRRGAGAGGGQEELERVKLCLEARF